MGVSIIAIYDAVILKDPYLDIIESELQHRLSINCEWNKKQNHLWDDYGNFIYTTVKWENVVSKISKSAIKYKVKEEEFFNYTINRWYDYWSDIAIELILSNSRNIFSTDNDGNKLFDFKMIVFPEGFGKSLQYTRENSKELMYWLANSSSQQPKKNSENIIFIVLYADDHEHWKLKAQISWLRDIISVYVATFDDSRLFRLQLQPYQISKIGLIWAVKGQAN
ncbi:hypothetical protein D1815_17010 [Aquimarina sp. AD1]|uniref:hypothetical protein n=1 Tax=Aquimarina sp. (strain AD1) TaxID=1714848 RepID=UPI000E4B2BA2|nr:hypothetical protein [Aquimarina sp. AD1]AXT57361.1 hypothetical protein D1815_17010 [Aquimarina sp. AD1]RKN11207.1 hypothetical protein D7035_19195 [Aquimarina sp. AD1]